MVLSHTFKYCTLMCVYIYVCVCMYVCICLLEVEVDDVVVQKVVGQAGVVVRGDGDAIGGSARVGVAEERLFQTFKRLKQERLSDFREIHHRISETSHTRKDSKLQHPIIQHPNISNTFSNT